MKLAKEGKNLEEPGLEEGERDDTSSFMHRHMLNTKSTYSIFFSRNKR
jgi:hypothetical protein